MSRNKNSGVVVQHEDGRTGIIYNKGLKVPKKAVVHWQVPGKEYVYEEKAVLVDPEKLKSIGFID